VRRGLCTAISCWTLGAATRRHVTLGAVVSRFVTVGVVAGARNGTEAGLTWQGGGRRRSLPDQKVTSAEQTSKCREPSCKRSGPNTCFRNLNTGTCLQSDNFACLLAICALKI